jgi:L-threonylcarbamoyladenylate synthase
VIPQPDWHLRQAARVVARGGLIAYPTEAVFGLGCDPWNVDSIQRLLAMKGRDVRKGLILIAYSVAQLEDFVLYPNAAVRDHVVASWPGPVTWVLPVRDGVPTVLRGGHASLAVRVTAHPIASALCRITGPLVSTSANRGGRPAARDSLHVRVQFGTRVEYVVPGPVGALGGPTEIRDAVTGKILRPALSSPPSR